ANSSLIYSWTQKKSENEGETGWQLPQRKSEGCGVRPATLSLLTRASIRDQILTCLQEITAVHIAEENILALISAAHDMIHCTGKFQSQLAWHRQRIRSDRFLVKVKTSFSTV